MSSNNQLIETMCGCAVIKDSREHDECRCDDEGRNWICADCYAGEYDEEEEEEEEEEGETDVESITDN